MVALTVSKRYKISPSSHGCPLPSPTRSVRPRGRLSFKQRSGRYSTSSDWIVGKQEVEARQRPDGASPGLLGPSCAEERAIVQRMSNENTELKSFFTRYEAANAMFDVEQIAACYAEVFMFGGPEGVQCVKKEDFLKVLPRRKEFFRSRGLVSSNIDSLAASTLDSNYTLVKVVWTMRFDRSASEPIYIQNTASYILSGANDRFQIVFQIDHQDLTKRVQELGLE